jgi:hypothetical protein
MNTPCSPAVLIAAAACAASLLATPVAAQAPITPGIAANPAARGPEPVQLSTGAGEILKLARAKINDDVTVAFVQNSDRSYNLTASEIVYLRKEGVSERVLLAMLNQPQSVAAPQSLPEAEIPATTAEASAPQYVTPPTTTAFVETTPASTVYVMPSTPTYYSFYDPRPYWYDPWPYYYPLFTFGFYWGGYYNGYWNNYCHYNKYPAPHNGHHPQPDNDRPSRDGNRPPPSSESSGPSSRPETLAASGQPTAGGNQTASNPGSRPVASRNAFATARPANLANNSGNQPTASRAGGGQVNAAASGSRPGASATSAQVRSTVNRTSSARPSGNQSGAQTLPANRISGPTSVWSSQARPATVSRPGVNQPSAAVVRTSRVSGSPTTISPRPINQPSIRPTTGYQQGTVRPSPSYRSTGSAAGFSPSSTYRTAGSASSAIRPSYNGGGAASYSRPSPTPSIRSMGSPSSFRGGGGSSGGGAPRMSSGGGARGGGGGRTR